MAGMKGVTRAANNARNECNPSYSLLLALCQQQAREKNLQKV